MRAVDVIAKKRDNGVLDKDEIDFFIQGFTRGEIADYQASAWAMAVYLRGMDEAETTALTLAMAHSGQVLDLSSVAPRVLDKHSSGGVGDKTTIVVGPLIASQGLPFGKMSGRGLGFSGGTLDKLESIPGFRSDLTTAEFVNQLKQHGIVVSGQTHDLAPADGKLYSLRDVTATVSSLPLIASSIMCKKIAAGAQIIVLDVKVGRGAFMKTEPEATALAELMVKIGRLANRQVAAVISDMDQPLGNAVGNALEVIEAIETLKGHGPSDFTSIASRSHRSYSCSPAPTRIRKTPALAWNGHSRTAARCQNSEIGFRRKGEHPASSMTMGFSRMRASSRTSLPRVMGLFRRLMRKKLG